MIGGVYFLIKEYVKYKIDLFDRYYLTCLRFGHVYKENHQMDIKQCTVVGCRKIKDNESHVSQFN